MKTNKLLIAGLCFSALGLFSCSDDENQNSYTDLTPDDHKEKLEKIGLNIVSKIDPKVQENLVKTFDALIEYSDDLNIEDNKDNEENNTDEEVAAFAKLMKSICADNNLANVSRLSNAENSELYDLARYAGVYEMTGSHKEDNDIYYTWKKTEEAKDKLELKFPAHDGTKAVVLITQEGNEQQFDAYNDGETKYSVIVPEIAKATVKYGDKEVLSLVCKMKVDNTAKTVVSDITVNASGYEYTEHIDVKPEKATTELNFSIDGKKLVNANAWINGKDMTNGDIIDDKLDNDAIKDLFKDGGAQVNIYSDNDEVNIIGGISNVKEFIDKLNELDEADWEEENTMDHQEKVAKVYNKYLEGNMFYNKNTKDVIATFSMQAYKDDEEGSSYADYDIEPIIRFTKDDSKYSFDEYFNDVDFNSLINKVEELGDQYDAYLKFN